MSETRQHAKRAYSPRWSQGKALRREQGPIGLVAMMSAGARALLSAGGPDFLAFRGLGPLYSLAGNAIDRVSFLGWPTTRRARSPQGVSSLNEDFGRRCPLSGYHRFDL